MISRCHWSRSLLYGSYMFEPRGFGNMHIERNKGCCPYLPRICSLYAIKCPGKHLSNISTRGSPHSYDCSAYQRALEHRYSLKRRTKKGPGLVEDTKRPRTLARISWSLLGTTCRGIEPGASPYQLVNPTRQTS